MMTMAYVMVLFKSRLRPGAIFLIGTTSHFLPHGLAQKTGGLDQQHHNEHGEDHRVRDVGVKGLGKDLDDAQENTAQHGARDGTDAAEDGGGKGLDTGKRAGGGHEGGIGRAQQHAGDGSQRGADRKGHGDGAVHVDAHELGGGLVLGAGPHGLAHFGAAGKPGQGQHNDHAGQHGDDSHMGNGKLAVKELDGAGAHHGGKHLRVGLPQQQGGVLEKITHADGGNENGQRGGLPQGFVGQPLNDHAQNGAYDHGQQHTHQRRQAELAGGEEADIGAHHDDVAMGEVEHFGNAVDHGVAQGDDGIDTAQTDAVDKVIEDTQGKSPLFLSLTGMAVWKAHPRSKGAADVPAIQTGGHMVQKRGKRAAGAGRQPFLQGH